MKITFKRKENAFEIPLVPALVGRAIITPVSSQADGKSGSTLDAAGRTLPKCSY